MSAVVCQGLAAATSSRLLASAFCAASDVCFRPICLGLNSSHGRPRGTEPSAYCLCADPAETPYIGAEAA